MKLRRLYGKAAFGFKDLCYLIKPPFSLKRFVDNSNRITRRDVGGKWKRGPEAEVSSGTEDEELLAALGAWNLRKLRMNRMAFRSQRSLDKI